MPPATGCGNMECEKKHLELEHIIKTLSAHSLKVVTKHEELLQNYKKTQDQYTKLKEKFAEKGEQIKQARKVLVPISMELKSLREQYNIALTCQAEAEHFATKVNHENKNLKRQSQILMQNFGSSVIAQINIDDDVEDTNTEEEYLDTLREKVATLENEKVELAEQVKDLKEDLSILEEKHTRDKEWVDAYKKELEIARSSVNRQKKTLTWLAKTSEAAFDEHEKLQTDFIRETKTRQAAETYAHKMFKEQESARRESAMLLKDIAPDQKLMEAMLEIQRLNENAAKMSAENAEKISSLEETLSSYKNNVILNDVEKEKEDLENQRDCIMEKFSIAEREIELLKQKNESLLAKYAELEKKFEDATRIPIPPPPPPPPIQPVKSSSIFDILKKGRKSKEQAKRTNLEKGGANVNNDYTKAIDEMMQRIKSGNTGLRKTVQNSNSQHKEEGTAMQELQGLLTKMKKSRSDEDLLSIDDSDNQEDSELQQMFRRRAELKQNKESEIQDNVKIPPVVFRRKPSTIPEEEEERD